jgi:Bacterial TSP3 repeat
MTVANLGDAPATGVLLDIALAPGSVPQKNAQCKTWISGHFICSVPDLSANDHLGGGTDEAGVVVNLQLPLVTSNSLATAFLHVSAANEPPANVGNNSGQINTALAGCPDLDGDNHITVLDMSLASLSFGKGLGDSGYNPRADQNGDQIITIGDLSIIASHFGQTCRGLDTDQDGLSDYDETHTYLTNPNNPDTDGDGLPDGVEALTYASNPLVQDTDGDWYTDGDEAALGKNPVIYCSIMASDIDHDHVVTVLDLNVAAVAFHKSTGDIGFVPQADLDKDGIVTVLDLGVMAQNFHKNVSLCP